MADNTGMGNPRIVITAAALAASVADSSLTAAVRRAGPDYLGIVLTP